MRPVRTADMQSTYQLFTKEELEAFDDMRPVLLAAHGDEERYQIGRDLLRTLWPEERTYIRKTHWINTKKPGVLTTLAYNHVQERLFDLIDALRAKDRLVRIIILKARQLGMSTAIQSWQYEQCDRKSHRLALTVNYDLDSTEELFRKSHLIHRRLWFPRPLERARGNVLDMSDNGSSFVTNTAGNLSAGRSYTFHNVHLSELPMWPNASIVLEGMLQAVPDEKDTSILVESTARGVGDEFHGMYKTAEAGQSDWVPFFAPWFWDVAYTRPFDTSDQRSRFAKSLDQEDRTYRERHDLTLEQMHWRRKITQTKLAGSERKFRQEYPASAEEAFLTSGSPAFNLEAIERLRSNIRLPRWQGEITLVR